MQLADTRRASEERAARIREVRMMSRRRVQAKVKKKEIKK